ncbi:MAG: hypothetical protein WEB58_19075 [Planctomycetaceae bacterium]
MWRDPIVDEIRQLRQEYAAQFNHDLKAICRDLRERQAKGGRKVVTLPPRPARQFKTDGLPAA